MSISRMIGFVLSTALFSGFVLSSGCERQVRAPGTLTPTVAPAPAPTATDLSGKWSYSGNGTHATLTLTQTVSSVSGTLAVTTVGHPDSGGTGIVSGSLTGNDIVMDLEFPSFSHFADGTIASSYKSMSGLADDNVGTKGFGWRALKQ